MTETTYITLRQDEKEALESWIQETYGDTSRITTGAAIRQLVIQQTEQ